MFEFLLIVPNLLASYMLMVNKAFESNAIYCFGYLCMLWHNYKIDDTPQMVYFGILELMAIMGVLLYFRNKKSKD